MTNQIEIKKKKRIKKQFNGNINNCSLCRKSCILNVCVECMVTKQIKDPKLYDIYMDCQNNFDKWQNKKYIKEI